MKLFKTTSLLSYLIILSLIFTSVLPAFANEDIQVAPVEEAISDTDDTANEIIPEEYSPDNHDSIAYDNSKYESTEEIPLPDDGENDVDDTVTLFGEEEEEVKSFEDVSHMTDEEFFGVWDAEAGEWSVVGKLNYDYSPDLAEVERLVKQNSYVFAKDALYQYYKNRSHIPKADYNSGIGWDRNALNSKDAYSFQEPYLGFTNVTSVGEYAEYVVDLGSTDASVFLLSSITKTDDMVCIAARDTEYSASLEITTKEGEVVTLEPVRDTYIRAYDDLADYSANSYGDSKELYVKDSWYQRADGRYMPYSSKTRRTYIAFDSDKIPGDVKNAYLKFYAKIVPEDGVAQATEDNHEILVFNAYNKSWAEMPGDNGNFAVMNWANFKIAHYSWNSLPGGFDWIRPDNVPSEFFNDNTRWQGITSLAKTSLIRGDETYMERAIEIALDFIEDTNGKIKEGSVPSGRDIESANRCVEAPGIFAGFMDSKYFNAEAMTAILKWLWEEMTYLYNGAGILYVGNTAQPTPNNYAETNRGLWHVKGTQAVCAYFPEYADRDEWKRVSDERLDVVAHVLVNDDGCYQEATTSYASSMISYFIAIYKYKQACGDEIPEWYEERVHNFAKYMMYISYGNHVAPYVGEGGAPNTKTALNNFLNLVEDEEMLYVATDGAEGVEPKNTAAYFQQLKIASCRTGWSANDSMLFMTAKNGGNHNHKDSLMILYYDGEKELIADTGMTSYDSGHPHFQWQRHTTRSHNTIEIDGKAQRGSNFLYNTKEGQENGDASLKLYTSAPVDRIVAWTDATKGFRHYRNVSYIKNRDFIIVSDMVSPEDGIEHTYTQNWHTYAQDPSHPTIDEYTKIGRTNYHGLTNLMIAQANTDNLTLSLEEGYSALSANPTKYFCYTQKAAGDVMFNTVLYPTKTGTTSNIGIENIDTGVDPAVASAMDINLFVNNDDVLNVFYYNSFEETPAERSFSGYTTNSSNVTIQQDVDGIPSFLSMYNGSSVVRDGDELIVSDMVLEDIEVIYDNGTATITSQDANIESAKLIIAAPGTVTNVTLNGEEIEYIYSNGKLYINNGEAVDYAADNGLFVKFLGTTDEGKTYPISIEIPAASIVSGAVTAPTCTFANGVFTVTMGNADLSSCAKIKLGGHSNQSVTADIDGSFRAVVQTVPLGSSRADADAAVVLGSPATERGRTDLTIWTKDATTFVITKSDDKDYGAEDEPEDENFPSSSPGAQPLPPSGGGGGGGGATTPDIKPLPPATSEDTEGDNSGTASGDTGSMPVAPKFEDCIGHWASEDIQFMYEKGYVNGTDDTTFAPDADVTRAEFAAMAVRILGLENVSYEGSFEDVAKDEWYADVVETAYKSGIILGSEGHFRPNDRITREEMAVILMRVYAMNNEYTAEGEATFTDSAEISHWAAESIASACRLGLVTGMDDGSFAPLSSTTRAQAATVFKRLLLAQNVKEG